MRTTLLIAVLILCLAGPAAAQKDSISKKKLYKAWLKLNTEPSRQKGVLFEIKESSVVLSDAQKHADYIDGKFTVSNLMSALSRKFISGGSVISTGGL
ncbi:MAG: hypothetical protein NTW31_13115 [Bacteroidetes bacterium]|nr:hypothetical protein [Bacteroidota bacterium]